MHEALAETLTLKQQAEQFKAQLQREYEAKNLQAEKAVQEAQAATEMARRNQQQVQEAAQLREQQAQAEYQMKLEEMAEKQHTSAVHREQRRSIQDKLLRTWKKRRRGNIRQSCTAARAKGAASSKYSFLVPP